MAGRENGERTYRVLLSRSSHAAGVEPMEIARRAGANDAVSHGCAYQAARRRTSQTVTPTSSDESMSSQPPSIHWNGQKRLTGW